MVARFIASPWGTALVAILLVDALNRPDGITLGGALVMGVFGAILPAWIREGHGPPDAGPIEQEAERRRTSAEATATVVWFGRHI